VGKTEAETIHKGLVARVQPPSLFVPELDPRLDEILRKALSREPARRYPTARDLALDIQASVPVAGAVDVSVWVERIAGDALAARAEAIWAIERDEADGPGAPAEAEPAMTPPSPVRLREPPSEPSRPTRSRTTVVLSVLLVAAVGAVGAVTLRRPGKTTVAPPLEAPTATPVASAATPANDPAILTASAPASSPAAPSATPGPSASSVARPPTRTSPRSVHPRRAACDPPYSIDAQGRQIFKPECM
jgi:serine/threonine-protein kinase